MATDVKICGITNPAAMTTAVEGGARFTGLVFYPPSPRHVDTEIASYLAGFVPENVQVVGLFVDPSDNDLAQVLDSVRIDMIQLHGTESPEQVAAIRDRFQLPVMKAVPVSSVEDLKTVPEYESVADWILFDAKTEGENPGGNGLPFDWTILNSFHSTRLWMLAGGLTPDNVQAALDVLSPAAVDVSSGVESAPGKKDPEKIRAFLKAVRDKKA